MTEKHKNKITQGKTKTPNRKNTKQQRVRLTSGSFIVVFGGFCLALQSFAGEEKAACVAFPVACILLYVSRLYFKSTVVTLTRFSNLLYVFPCFMLALSLSSSTAVRFAFSSFCIYRSNAWNSIRK